MRVPRRSVRAQLERPGVGQRGRARIKLHLFAVRRYRDESQLASHAMSGPAHDLPWLDEDEADPFFDNVVSEDVMPPTKVPLFGGAPFPIDPMRQLSPDEE